MSKNEMITMIETMNNYDDLASKAKAKADAIREAIKEEMVRQNTEELVAGAYIVRFTNVISNRFDSTTFKRQILLDVGWTNALQDRSRKILFDVLRNILIVSNGRGFIVSAADL